MKKTIALLLVLVCILLTFSLVVAEEKSVELVFTNFDETLFVNKTSNLKVKLENTKEKAKFEYSSSDENIAEITEKGQIKAIAPGTTTIKCIAITETAEYENSYILTVINPIKSIKLDKKINMAVDTSYPLNIEITPEDATNKNIIWSSSKENIATVSDTGVLFALKKGSTTITATSTDGSNKKASVNVNVKEYDAVIRSKEGSLVGYSTGSGMFGIGYKTKNESVDYSSDVDSFNVDDANISLGDSVVKLIPLKAGEDTFTVQVVNYLTRKAKNFKYNVYITPEALKYATNDAAKKADNKHIISALKNKFDLAYERKLKEYNLYYLIDTDLKETFWFVSNDTFVDAATYKGDLNKGIDLIFKDEELKGQKYSLRFQNENDDSILIMKDDYGQDFIEYTYNKIEISKALDVVDVNNYLKLLGR